ncbi:peptidoglycan-recognition protein 1-like isoform X2 [Macrosteles quadrilineatus]|uniref:peptidoglycan-recognition protein 1-like isoform X2 n=1 Tax=Macrosteles quadrilineatus TaxID=74068 RepID=UPI0023E2A41D|nr:peptidoglycan-recognition protein 1-like isoform X2 [Macrosteles quadrilineatus]
MKYLQRPYIQLVTREDWGAVPPRKKPELLELPAKMLMLFDTQTEECKTTAECKKIVKRLQDEYMNLKGYQDIPWNFLIGADGKAYEGRGWKAKPFKTNLGNAKQAEWDGRSLDVAYIGDYRYNLPEGGSSQMTINLIQLLREMKALDPTQLQMYSFMIQTS